MRILKNVFWALFLFQGSGIFGQTHFTIDGRISGLKDGTKLYLVHNKGSDTLVSTDIKNGLFTFNGNLSLEGEFCFLKLDTTISKKALPLILVSTKILIVGDIQKWPDLSITGSQPFDDYKRLLQLIDGQKNKLSSFINLFNDLYKSRDSALRNNDSVLLRRTELEIKNLSEKNKIANDNYIKIMLDYIDNNLNSLYTPHLILKVESVLGKEKMALIYSSLSEEAKKSYYGIQLNNKIKIQVGSIAPDFSAKTPGGEILSLRKIANGKRIIIIDFWASWCKPCREENSKLKKIFQKYKSKGIAILSFSFDKNELLWKAAIKKDGMVWHNISDLKGINNSPVAQLYNIYKIPATILLNGNSEILAIDLSLSELEMELSKYVD